MVTALIEQISEDIVETIHESLLVLDSDLKVILADLPMLEQEMRVMFKEEVRIAPQINWVPAETLPREIKKQALLRSKGLRLNCFYIRGGCEKTVHMAG